MPGVKLWDAKNPFVSLLSPSTVNPTSKRGFRFGRWRARRDSNPRPSVLKLGAKRSRGETGRASDSEVEGWGSPTGYAWTSGAPQQPPFRAGAVRLALTPSCSISQIRMRFSAPTGSRRCGHSENWSRAPQRSRVRPLPQPLVARQPYCCAMPMRICCTGSGGTPSSGNSTITLSIVPVNANGDA